MVVLLTVFPVRKYLMVQTPADPEPRVLDVVAIDGPSGAGKSTVAKKLAVLLGFSYLDTGALYRAVTWYLLESGFDVAEGPDLEPVLDQLTLQFTAEGRTLLNDRDVTAHLRSREVESRVSAVSALPEVRSRMRDLQRQIARQGSLVAEGRDMGSVVFPDARWKFYLDAAPVERAERRRKDFAVRGRSISASEVLEELEGRDRLDRTRKDAPLTRVADAEYLDSTKLTADQAVDRMMRAIDRE